MKSDQLAQQIDEIERALQHEDPSLARRFETLQRRDKRNDLTVFSLLAISVALLTFALATMSIIAGCAGVAAYVATSLVDHRHHRNLTGPSHQDRRRAPWQ